MGWMRPSFPPRCWALRSDSAVLRAVRPTGLSSVVCHRFEVFTGWLWRLTVGVQSLRTHCVAPACAQHRITHL
jgi:hypothetical protein